VIENGKIHRVDKVALYKHAEIFFEYINYFYVMKLGAEKRGDAITRQFAKLMLNSLYGKFAQRTREYTLVDYPAPCDYCYETLVDASTKERSIVIYIENKGYKLEKTEKLFHDAMIAVASHVTAYARMYLWELIKQAGLEHVYYCDTDSLIVDQQGYKNLETFIGDKLGMLKVEGIANTLKILAPKDYIFGDEVKRKGIKKDDIQIDESTYLGERFAKTKTLIRQGYPEGVLIQEVEKHLNYEYDKGIVQPDGTVKPFQLYEE